MSDKLERWLAEELRGDGLPLLLEEIRKHRARLVYAGLRPGDTDYQKGQVVALNWVLELPENLLADTETETVEG